ncbi:hypothetical protein N9966_00415 [bacterium]|nr:hypothetical protein [bacterium]
MEPNKSIPSFCFESPCLKPFDLNIESVEVTAGTRRIRATWNPELAQDLEFYHNIDAEAELTRLLTEEINRGNTIAQDLVAIQPMDAPQGNLFYFDYNYGPIEEPVVYDDGSWSMGNTFDGVIGIKSEIKQHTLI